MTIISDDPKDQTKKELRMRNYILHGLPVVILLIIIAWMTYGRKSMEKRLRTQVVECHHRLMTLRTYTTKRQIECAGQQLKNTTLLLACMKKIITSQSAVGKNRKEAKIQCNY